VISGHGARDAVAETLSLARRADQLGYHRYWLAEHHAIAALADPCPEVLLARLGAETQRIRVGTGGVLLPYYSAFRTAEAFRMLEALYPGRVDLGIGRAPGGDARHRYTPEERQYVLAQRARAVIGGPERCRREMEAMAARYGADEVMVLTITGDYASRLRSYERLIGAF